MFQIIAFVVLAFSIFIAVFAVQSTTPVAVSFLTVHAEAVAVSLLVLISAAGAAIMLLFSVAREVQHRPRHRSLSQQLSAAESRVRELDAQAAITVAREVQHGLWLGAAQSQVRELEGHAATTSAEQPLLPLANTFNVERPAATSPVSCVGHGSAW